MKFNSNEDNDIILPKDVEKFNFIDKVVDLYFNTNTMPSIGDTKNLNSEFYNYLPTTYAYFEELFTKYPFKQNDCFVDIGCGKGRGLLMAALYGAKKICGVEINKVIFCELYKNYLNWLKFEYLKNIDIQLINKSALEVEIKDEWNKFFMFKPFNNDAFKTILLNIHHAKKDSKQNIYLYLYHPDKDIIQWLEDNDLFKIIEKDFQLIEKNNGNTKKKIRSCVYSNHPVEIESSRWRYWF